MLADVGTASVFFYDLRWTVSAAVLSISAGSGSHHSLAS